MTACEPITAYMVYIHLADGEYQFSRTVNGVWMQDGDNMRRAAQEVFDAHPDKPHMVAYVMEHGGWHLAFNKQGIIMETANDQAVLSDAAKEYGELLKGAKWEYLPSVRRV